MFRSPSPFLSASSNVCFNHVQHVKEQFVCRGPPKKKNHSCFRRDKFQDTALHITTPKGILVMCALPFGQRVFIADAGHQVAEASDPGSGLFCVGRHQVQGLHVVPVVHRKTAGRVEAAVGMPMEDVRLAALRHFVQGIDGNWRNEDVGEVEKGTMLLVK